MNSINEATLKRRLDLVYILLFFSFKELSGWYVMKIVLSWNLNSVHWAVVRIAGEFFCDSYRV